MVVYAEESGPTLGKTTNRKSGPALMGGFTFNLYIPPADANTGTPTGGADAHTRMVLLREANRAQMNESNLSMKGRDASASALWAFPAPQTQTSPWTQTQSGEDSWMFQQDGKRMMVSASTYGGQSESRIAYEPWPLFVPRESMAYFPIERPIEAKAAGAYRENAYMAAAWTLPHYLRTAVETMAWGNPAQVQDVDMEGMIAQLQQKLSREMQKTDAIGRAERWAPGVLRAGLQGHFSPEQIELAIANYQAILERVRETPLISYATGTARQEEYTVGRKTYTRRELNLDGAEKIGKLAAIGMGVRTVEARLFLDPQADAQTRGADLDHLANELEAQNGGAHPYAAQMRELAGQLRAGTSGADERFEQMLTQISELKKQDRALAHACMLGQGFLVPLPGIEVDYQYRLEREQTRGRVREGQVEVEYHLHIVPRCTIALGASPDLLESELTRTLGQATLVRTNAERMETDRLDIQPEGNGYRVDFTKGARLQDGLRLALFAPYGFMGSGGESPSSALAFEFGGVRPWIELSPATIKPFKLQPTMERPMRIELTPQPEPWARFTLGARAGWVGARAYYEQSNTPATEAQKAAIRQGLSNNLDAQRYKFDQYLRQYFNQGDWSLQAKLEKNGPFAWEANASAGYIRQPTSTYQGADISLFNMGAAFVRGGLGANLLLVDDVRLEAGGEYLGADFHRLPGALRSPRGSQYSVMGSFEMTPALGGGSVEIGRSVDGRARLDLVNTKLGVRADKDWLNIGLNTQLDLFRLSGPGADALTPLDNRSLLQAGGRMQSVLKAAGDLQVRLYRVGMATLNFLGEGQYDLKAGMPMQMGVALQFQLSHPQAENNVYINAGQRWIYQGGAERFSKMAYGELGARFLDYFSMGAQASYQRLGPMPIRSATVFVRASIPILEAGVGTRKTTDETASAYRIERSEPVLRAPVLEKETPQETARAPARPEPAPKTPPAPATNPSETPSAGAPASEPATGQSVLAPAPSVESAPIAIQSGSTAPAVVPPKVESAPEAPGGRKPRTELEIEQYLDDPAPDPTLDIRWERLPTGTPKTPAPAEAPAQQAGEDERPEESEAPKAQEVHAAEEVKAPEALKTKPAPQSPKRRAKKTKTAKTSPRAAEPAPAPPEGEIEASGSQTTEVQTEAPSEEETQPRRPVARAQEPEPAQSTRPTPTLQEPTPEPAAALEEEIETPTQARAPVSANAPLSERLTGRIGQFADDYAKTAGIGPMGEGYLQILTAVILEGQTDPGIPFSKAFGAQSQERRERYVQEFLTPLKEWLGPQIPIQIEVKETARAQVVSIVRTGSMTPAQIEAALEAKLK